MSGKNLKKKLYIYLKNVCLNCKYVQYNLRRICGIIQIRSFKYKHPKQTSKECI